MRLGADFLPVLPYSMDMKHFCGAGHLYYFQNFLVVATRNGFKDVITILGTD